MKAYTDLEQSKKLAEILPIESADMFYYKDAVTKEDNPRVMDYSQVPKNKSMYYTPCWNLAALLNAVDFNTINLHYDNAKIDWVASATIHDSTKHCTKYESTRALNPVDACVEMIIKLHEQKML